MLYQNQIDVPSVLRAHLEFLNEQRNLISTHIDLIEQKLQTAMTGDEGKGVCELKNDEKSMEE